MDLAKICSFILLLFMGVLGEGGGSVGVGVAGGGWRVRVGGYTNFYAYNVTFLVTGHYFFLNETYRNAQGPSVHYNI